MLLKSVLRWNYLNRVKSVGFYQSLTHCNSVQLLSPVQLFATPWTAARQASLSITNSQNLLKLMSIESVMPSNHLILCGPLSLPPTIFPSIRVFSNVSVLRIRWPKYWCFSHQSFRWIFRIDFIKDGLDISLCSPRASQEYSQHHSSKASILWCSAFFIVQFSHLYMTTGKTTVWTRQTFASKIKSLLFNMLRRLVITSLPRSKCLLISALQSPFAVILEPPKIVCHCFHCFPTYLPWSDGTRCHDLGFLNVELSQLFMLLFHFNQEAF